MHKTIIKSAFAAFFLTATLGCGRTDPTPTNPTIAKATELPGHVTLIKASELPPPHATVSADNGPHVVAQPDGTTPLVPPGFTVSLFASGLRNPRNLAIAPDGKVFVVCSEPHQIWILNDSKGVGVADQRILYTDDLTQPFGIAFHGNYIYVGNTDSVVRFAYTKGDTVPQASPETVVPNLPANGYHNHWTRDVAFSKDGKTMFVSVGSQENLGIEEPRRATILAFDPDGNNFHVYASGLRNAVGLTIDPLDGQLWACVNERDGLGDDLPPDYATSIQENGFYGWPYSYIGQHPDPTYGTQRPDLVAKAITPDVLIEPHGAAVSITFGTSAKFPAAYRGGAFVALHGSWNRSVRSGYKVIYIPFKGTKPVDGSYSDFLTGFVLPTGNVWGRLVGLAFAPDGSLLVCDDGGGKIWRIAYTGGK